MKASNDIRNYADYIFGTMPLLFKGTGMKVHTSKSVQFDGYRIDGMRCLLFLSDYRCKSWWVECLLSNSLKGIGRNFTDDDLHSSSFDRPETAANTSTTSEPVTAPTNILNPLSVLQISRSCKLFLSILELAVSTGFSSEFRCQYRFVDHIQYRCSEWGSNQSEIRSTLPALVEMC